MEKHTIFNKPALKNPSIQIDTEFGLHICNFTGNCLVDDTDGVFVEVVLDGRVIQYVRVLHNFPVFSAILKKSWFENEEYKGLFGYVAFIKGNPAKGVLIGVSPTAQSELSKELTTSWKVATEQFNVVLDDKENAATFCKVVKNKKGRFYFGEKDKTKHEPMLLGSTTLEKVAELHNLVVDLSNALLKLTVIPASLGVPTSIMVNASEVVQIQAKLAKLKTEYATSLSETNFLT